MFGNKNQSLTPCRITEEGAGELLHAAAKASSLSQQEVCCEPRCHVNVAHIRQSKPDSRQSRPDSGLGFQVKVPLFRLFPFRSAAGRLLPPKPPPSRSRRSVCEPSTTPSTRWSTTLSPKVNLHHVINFRALCVQFRLRNPRISGQRQARTPPCGPSAKRSPLPSQM